MGLAHHRDSPGPHREAGPRDRRGQAVLHLSGWGPQRTTNGENISRAIGMLAVLTGNVGIKGGNTGARENAGYKLPMATFPTLEIP